MTTGDPDPGIARAAEPADAGAAAPPGREETSATEADKSADQTEDPQAQAAGPAAEADGKQAVDADAEQSADNYVEDLIRPFGRSAVADSVRATASFIGETHIGSVIISTDDGRYRIPLSDLVALHAHAVFTRPPGYDDLIRALASRRVVLCSGPNGCGKELAVTRALEQADAKTVRLLPASLSLSDMSRVVDMEVQAGGAFVLPALDDAWLRALAGPSGQSIRAAAASGKVKVVAVTASEPLNPVVRPFDVARLKYPDAQAVLAAYVAARRTPDSVRELAQACLEQLDPPVSPATVEAVLAEATRRPASSADEIADTFAKSVATEAISQWIGEGRLASDVAILAAGATLSGTPDVVVQEQADDLLARLEPAEARDQSSRLIGGSAAWPAGLLQSVVAKVGTHFGVQPATVIEVAPPHRPEDVMRAIWQPLGPAFRSHYCDWLVELPAKRELGWDAAYTAGVLLTIDPMVIKARVLDPWLKSRQPTRRRCAGIALGAPVAIGDDPSTARQLANDWATSDATQLRQAAVAAYGGLLGAWDAASAAPLKLFMIGQVAPELRQEADGALASLVVAGAEATGSRTAVISYLKLTLADRVSRSRTFGCLPVIVGALVRANPVCAESLAALRIEQDNWLGLLGLVAAALVEPVGLPCGQRCLYLLVRASAFGDVDHELVEDAIRAMKKSQRSAGTVARLGSAIRRSLAALARSDEEEIAATAAALVQHFFRLREVNEIGVRRRL